MTKKIKENKIKGYEYIPLNDNEHYFYSYDLGISAMLISVGFELISIDGQNPHKVLFIFKKKPDINNRVDEYFSDKVIVPARSFFENIKMLKNRIYNTF
jgi:hypothetical protein